MLCFHVNNSVGIPILFCYSHESWLTTKPSHWFLQTSVKVVESAYYCKIPNFITIVLIILQFLTVDCTSPEQIYESHARKPDIFITIVESGYLLVQQGIECLVRPNNFDNWPLDPQMHCFVFTFHSLKYFILALNMASSLGTQVEKRHTVKSVFWCVVLKKFK